MGQHQECSWWQTYPEKVQHSLRNIRLIDPMLFDTRLTMCGRYADLNHGCNGDVSGRPRCKTCAQLVFGDAT
jgi:hypothetical protein